MRKRLIFSSIIGVLSSYLYFRRRYLRWKNPSPVDLQVEFVSMGSNTSQGNVIGIQPHMTALDYISAEHFMQKLGHYLCYAKRNGNISPLGKSIVIFPEYVGTWLIESGRSTFLTFDSKSLLLAQLALILWNIPKFIFYFISTKSITKAVFHMVSAHVARVYSRAFSTLARQYSVTIVGGSVVLPDPYVTCNG